MAEYSGVSRAVYLSYENGELYDDGLGQEMYIKNIKLKNFRNYHDLALDFDEKINFIVGNNAQGKTNLIEGIFMSALGKSFRTVRDSELINFDSDFCRIEVCAQKSLDDTAVEIIIRKDAGKAIKVDGTSISKTSELLDNIYIVVFSPEDLKIVKEEPEKRRRFIDRELSIIKPLYYDSLSSYKKVLAQRNAYLKERQPEPSVLDIWDTQLSAYGARIISMRENFVEKVNRISREIHKKITDNRETLELTYDPNIKNGEELETVIYEELKNSFANDLRLRTTTRGPHRDDLQFFINGINVRSFGSQGQQRTAALSLKLAELSLIKEETGESAVLLLDDVMSELDPQRQEFLIRSLDDIQLFITATEITENLKPVVEKGKILSVEGGKIRL